MDDSTEGGLTQFWQLFTVIPGLVRSKILNITDIVI